MRILVVEDETALAEGLEFNFQQEGYDVDLAGDGPAAFQTLNGADPPIDLVILDLMLPGMSGYEICRQIRENDLELPILVLSSRTLSEDKAQAFDAGTDQYMTKPFALPELLSRVRNLLERRGQRLARRDVLHILRRDTPLVDSPERPGCNLGATTLLHREQRGARDVHPTHQQRPHQH